MPVKPPLRVSAPGRICLFGEHQDYLHLPVIPCAISLRVGLEGRFEPERRVHLDLPDIGAEMAFGLEGEQPYMQARDYFRSGFNVMHRLGYTFGSGFDVSVHGEIPINSGTSSSSALLVAWIDFLARFSDQRRILDAETVARLAHEAEVVEFHEPGGMMDHFSTAVGRVLYLDFEPRVSVTPLSAPLGRFVLGDSGEPKDTQGILARVKDRVITIAGQLRQTDPGFRLRALTPEGVQAYKPVLSVSDFALLEGTVTNHAITLRARAALEAEVLGHALIGRLLNAHQDVLRDVLAISTPKIDRMLSAALEAGALGGKINGSGGGGCMFAYAPDRAEAVAEAIESEGGKAYIVTPAEGVKSEGLTQ